ncbi:hypothetical protein [Pedobacter heparinus]|uniref:hypothetical protein n=1 Tax=Pedobacter heparinus TaxID=984 RepID=UPI00292E63D3|nr:hypothetical protein [Pedobacter heparinus]
MNRIYKNTSVLLLLMIAAASLTGCKKDKKTEEPGFTCSTCKDVPDAKAEYNSNSKGIYKGIVVGSTGTLFIDIMNSGTVMKATMVLDGITVNFTTVSVWTSGQPLVTDFTATANSQVYSFRFSVDAVGGNATTSSLTIPGHTIISFQLIKETSDNLVKCYEGSTVGKKDSGAAQAGSLNVVISSKTNTWTALSKDKLSTSGGINFVAGTITGNTLNCNCGPTTTVTGVLDNDEIIGTYKGSDNSGTWNAKRTL